MRDVVVEHVETHQAGTRHDYATCQGCGKPWKEGDRFGYATEIADVAEVHVDPDCVAKLAKAMAEYQTSGQWAADMARIHSGEDQEPPADEPDMYSVRIDE
jgi:pyruvoyl-dependent arginine decarboxylase (PvlArgDC)